MNTQETRSILTIALLAAFADGMKDERERTAVKRVAEALGPPARDGGGVRGVDHELERRRRVDGGLLVDQPAVRIPDINSTARGEGKYIGAGIGGFILPDAAVTVIKADAIEHHEAAALERIMEGNTAGVTGWLLVRLGVVDRTMARETWIAPVLDFFDRYGTRTALLLLALIGLYRISDIVLGVISNVFYQDMGFTKTQIATAVKTFGVVVSIAGGLLGGLMANRYGVMRILMLGAILSAATNLIYVWLAWVGNDAAVLYLAVAADNLAAGLASAAFVAFLSSLTSVAFTAVQYAIFSSLMTLLPKVLGGYSGTMVEAIGYPAFFVFTTLIGVPVLLLVWLAGRHLQAGPAP